MRIPREFSAWSTITFISTHPHRDVDCTEKTETSAFYHTAYYVLFTLIVYYRTRVVQPFWWYLESRSRTAAHCYIEAEIVKER